MDKGLDRDQGLIAVDAGRGSRGLGRRVSRVLHPRPRLRLALLLSGPVAWLLVAYLGSLAALLITSVYRIDPFTTAIVKDVSADNYRELLDRPVYGTIMWRTLGIAVVVTVVDAIIAVPMAFTMAKIAKTSWRSVLVVAVLMPLWASYLVKAYAWRTILNPAGGILRTTFGASPGFGLVGAAIVLGYLWLPYMILPIYAGLERLPDSLLEASSDLGARAGTTFRHIVLPILMPAIVAGSIFTFSLTLGDYITVKIVGGRAQLIGNVVFDNFGSNNIPFAAAFAMVPVTVMIVYLALVRRTGALENL